MINSLVVKQDIGVKDLEQCKIVDRKGVPRHLRIVL